MEQPARFGDVLNVRTTTDALSNRTFTLAFRVTRKGTDDVIAEGRSVQVWLDADRRPAPIPAAHRDRLEASQAGSALTASPDLPTSATAEGEEDSRGCRAR